MKKKVSYPSVLKEAIASAMVEFDTSKTVDVTGPMVDPILKWDGQGELPVTKDAASILERYYFEESSDKGIEIQETELNQNGTEKKTASEKDATGAGTQQAGTDKSSNMSKRKKDIEKEIEEAVKEAEKEVDDDDKEVVDEPPVEDDSITEDLENTVIEKLIAEMDEADEEKEEEKDEDAEEEDLDIDEKIKESKDEKEDEEDDADEEAVEEMFKIFKDNIEDEELD